MDFFLLWELIFIGVVLTLMYRNSRVFKFRMAKLKEISSAADEDIRLGHEYRWRYDEYSSVTYGEQVFQFWKPLDSFWEKNPARAEK